MSQVPLLYGHVVYHVPDGDIYYLSSAGPESLKSPQSHLEPSNVPRVIVVFHFDRILVVEN